MLEVTKYLKVNKSAHILYLFEDEEKYIANLMAYIKSGIERRHHLMIIESTEIFRKLERKFDGVFSEEEQSRIHHYDNSTFYGSHGDFHSESIVKHFGKLIESFRNDNVEIRTWAHVELREQEDLICKITEHEITSDQSVMDLNLMSVCAYAAMNVPASLQTNMMRSHEYLMTDTELVKSTLYRRSSLS